MISFQKAVEIAKKHYPNWTIYTGIEFDDYYTFEMASPVYDENQIGEQFSVDKTTGDIREEVLVLIGMCYPDIWKRRKVLIWEGETVAE